MRTVSPRRAECIAEARRLFAAGDAAAAWDVLVGDRYDHGIDAEVDAELRRLFPAAPPDVAAALVGYQRQLDDPDDRARQKAVRGLSRVVLVAVSNRVLRFVQPAETMTFFLRNLDHPDAVVREHVTICVARALDKYVHDDRAFGPLARALADPKPNTRAWAVEGLAALSDDFVPLALPLLGDRVGRVRAAASSALSLAMRGGGTVHRPPLGADGRRLVADFMAAYDLTLPAAERADRAWFLAETAEPRHRPALEAWYAKDRSKEVRKYLQAGLTRLG